MAEVEAETVDHPYSQRRSYLFGLDRNLYVSGLGVKWMEDDVYLDLILILLMLQAMNRWGYYPLILIGSWTFGTINRIHAFVEPHHHLFWLYCLDIGTASLMVRASWQSWPLNHELVLHKISLCLLWLAMGCYLQSIVVEFSLQSH